MIDPAVCAFLINQKIIMTVVSKGLATRLLQALKSAGSEGGTIMPGRGTAPASKWNFFGLNEDPDKEVLLTVIHESKVDNVLTAVDRELNLTHSPAGISFVMKLSQVRGVIHQLDHAVLSVQNQEVERVSDKKSSGYELIVSIVVKGYADLVIDAARDMGATGGTVLYGRGIGVHEKGTIFGRPIEPEKEIVLTLVKSEHVEKTRDAIMEKAEICKPGKGIVFILDVEQAVGLPDA
jgi:nitrogen regulatory protein PII